VLSYSVSSAGVVALVGPLVKDAIPAVQDGLVALASAKGDVLALDLAGVTRVDSAGVALLGVLESQAKRAARAMRITALSATARDALEVFRLPIAGEPPSSKSKPYFERLGQSAVDSWVGLVAFLQLTADTMLWSLGGARRTARVRRGAMWDEAVLMGSNALPIVLLIALLIGVVLALQSAYQLRQFGGNIYVANLIAVSMTREMGPLITAIIIAGRSGAAIAAEVASMNVSEEMAALQTMGIEPVRYVVVPKFQALTLTMPALTIFANVIGILGGGVVAYAYLDLGPMIYLRQAYGALVLLDVGTGMLKSVVFAWLIVLIGASCGFSARGGAESVGLVTTQSVVRSIFWVIVSDAAFSLVFYFG
jgi:phospholipid/cholesterol/gamma-HCH transport system permease protein